MEPLDDNALNLLFRHARTYGTDADSWLAGPITDQQLEQMWDLAKMGPTSANCSPARVLFLRSPEAKAKLKPALDEGNVEKTMAAPVTAILGMDLAFYERLPYLFPHVDAKSWFEHKPVDALRTIALRNGSLQGAYLIMAARALGLDCGPMSGFDQKMVDELFFKGTRVESNFLINIGHGNPATLFPRSPRLDFGHACQVL